jgi:hypothetical protein
MPDHSFIPQYAKEITSLNRLLDVTAKLGHEMLMVIEQEKSPD